MEYVTKAETAQKNTVSWASVRVRVSIRVSVSVSVRVRVRVRVSVRARVSTGGAEEHGALGKRLGGSLCDRGLVEAQAARKRLPEPVVICTQREWQLVLE